MPPPRGGALAKVMLGGAIVLGLGILIGSS